MTKSKSGIPCVRTDWTKEMMEDVARLWATGMSARNIGVFLAGKTGLTITKSAVLGKVQRLKLSPRDSPLVKKGTPRRYAPSAPKARRPSPPKVAAPKVAAPKKSKPLIIKASALAGSLNVALDIVQASDGCRRPTTDERPYLYCGLPRHRHDPDKKSSFRSGSPYCTFHLSDGTVAATGPRIVVAEYVPLSDRR